jgi:sucrose-6-phosphate hydrolase SacC (GH32 family)
LPVLTGGDPNATFAFEERPAPVMERGMGWDASDLLNPSIATDDKGIAPTYLNLYSGFDGNTWRTGLATTGDGEHFERKGIILAPDPGTWEGSYLAANGSAVFYEKQFWYWYVSGPRGRHSLGLARANEWDYQDAKSWRKEKHPVLEPGPWGSWDERAVADPDVIRVEPYFYLYYLGQDRGARQKIGVARSRDGVRWEKLRSNPVLAADENVGEPAVWQSHGFYWMLYTVRQADQTRHLRLARSTDGVHWTALAAEFRGAQAWDSKVMCDATVVVAGGRVLVWFGGGDVARPDENIHGQIGFGVLRPVSATLEK